MKEQHANKLIDEMAANYNTIADHFAQTRHSQWRTVSQFADRVVKENQEVLDLGCGNGRVAEIINKIKANYTGMDLSANLIAHAKTDYPQNTFLVGNMMETGFEDMQFDTVMLIASFHHIPSREKRLETLKEIARITKNGGTIFMTNWNLHQDAFKKQRLRTNWEKLIGKHNRDWNDVMIPWKDAHGTQHANRYYHGFTLQELKHLVSAVPELKLVEQYYDTRGEKSTKKEGHNIITLIQKK